jgi:ribosomal protein S8
MYKNVLFNLCNVFEQAKQKKLSVVKLKFLNKYVPILSILLKEGYIRGFFIGDFKDIKFIYILLKFTSNSKNICRLKMVIPRFSINCSYALLNKNLKGFNTSIILTNKGLLSDLNAVKLKLGGLRLIDFK